MIVLTVLTPICRPTGGKSIARRAYFSRFAVKGSHTSANCRAEYDAMRKCLTAFTVVIALVAGVTAPTPADARRAWRAGAFIGGACTPAGAQAPFYSLAPPPPYFPFSAHFMSG